MKKYIKQIVFLAVMIACILFENNAYAAGSFSIKTSKSEINQGESFTLSIIANNAYGQVNITASNATVSPSTVFLQNDTKTVTVTSVNSGDIVVNASPAASGVGDQDENPIESSANPVNIKIKKTTSNNNGNSNSGDSTGTNSGTTQTNQGTSSNQASSNQSNNTQTKSSVAILGNLGIKPNDFDFSGFTPNKTSYSTTVPNSVSSIEVYAVSPQNQKQTISGTGKKQLKEGQNNFEIKVTAEDGKTTKTYKLTVTREKSNSSAGEEATGEETTENTVESNDVTENNNQEQNEENIESDEQKIGLSELKIEGLTLSPEFKKNVYEYNTKLEDDKESLEIIATPITEGSKVDITGNENLKDGENTITIIVSDESDENMATYQINVTKEKKQENVVNLTYKIIKENFVIVILVVAILIVIIILIVHLIKNKNSVYSGIYMPYEEGVTEHEDIHQNEFKKEKKNHAKMKKSKGKRFK